ncbi:MAG: nuclear transport factor 2 family protein [Calditrichaeota bacterium]|nr:nuclear transport factor 2 family protein [Calditrichota bacterium]
MKFISIILLILINSCMQKAETDATTIAKWKQEIIQAEADFAQMASDSGITKAFYHFAAEDAVINRRDSIVSSKTGIRHFYESSSFKYKSLKWKPDFVDVSKSGDLAYTYGKYSFAGQLPNGNEISGSGIFHSVWRRQNDGSWKYVWD